MFLPPTPLQAGSQYDLAVIFRVCQLWFNQDGQPENAPDASELLSLFSHLFDQVSRFLRNGFPSLSLLS